MAVPVTPMLQAVEPVSPWDVAVSGERAEKAESRPIAPTVCTTYAGSVNSDFTSSDSCHIIATANKDTSDPMNTP